LTQFEHIGIYAAKFYMPSGWGGISKIPSCSPFPFIPLALDEFERRNISNGSSSVVRNCPSFQ